MLRLPIPIFASIAENALNGAYSVHGYLGMNKWNTMLKHALDAGFASPFALSMQHLCGCGNHD
jgi:hypothetical protein